MKVKARGSFLTPSAWQAIAVALRFSPMECEVVKALLVDDSEKSIAAAVGRSPHTVHAHLERLYRKLGVTSRSQLVVAVFRESLLSKITSAE